MEYEIIINENKKFLEKLNTNIIKIAEQEEILKGFEEYKTRMLNQLENIKKEIENKTNLIQKLKNEIENNKEKEIIILEIEKLKKENTLITKNIKENNNI